MAGLSTWKQPMVRARPERRVGLRVSRRDRPQPEPGLRLGDRREAPDREQVELDQPQVLDRVLVEVGHPQTLGRRLEREAAIDRRRASG